MGLYLVVHHRLDPNQSWSNEWIDDQRLQTILTTPEVGELCARAQQHGQEVFVHRCEWGGVPPTVCCKVKVASVKLVDERNRMVSFSDILTMNQPPPGRPMRGQNSYEA